MSLGELLGIFVKNNFPLLKNKKRKLERIWVMSLLTESILTLNTDVLDNYIKLEVERLVELRFEELRSQFSKDYYFDDCLLSREEVAKKLDVSIGKLDGLRKKNKLKSCPMGKGVKFRKSDVLEYIKSL